MTLIINHQATQSATIRHDARPRSYLLRTTSPLYISILALIPLPTPQAEVYPGYSRRKESQTHRAPQ
ncbi:uncharacterized protein An02g11310 [Aspergillus niger]|uniref:Contig An02c0330, genomic contig n=2 Tax=Aspergillus niger TaxID=5061 RepID=A2QEJ4_ASPNC|nr:uncharacterized protein An02g11310 [Aspergillus niger]CAK44461.1 unnamed protein product [Aspergillus niger]